jgi:hypothetical protein
MGQEVYRAAEFDILPLNPNISVLYPPHPVEGHLLALVRSHLSASFFLFSYGWDVTTRLQAQWAAQGSTQRQALWEAVCNSFRWPHSLLIVAGR